MDEAWRFIQHPTLRAYVQEALKTWRKRNAAMMLATQTARRLRVGRPAPHRRRELSDASCCWRIRRSTRQQYAELFQLNEHGSWTC